MQCKRPIHTKRQRQCDGKVPWEKSSRIWFLLASAWESCRQCYAQVKVMSLCTLSVALHWRWRSVWMGLQCEPAHHFYLWMTLATGLSTLMLMPTKIETCWFFPVNVTLSRWRWRLVWMRLKIKLRPIHTEHWRCRYAVLASCQPMSSMGKSNGFVHTHRWHCITPKMLGNITISWRWRLVWRGLTWPGRLPLDPPCCSAQWHGKVALMDQATSSSSSDLSCGAGHRKITLYSVASSLFCNKRQEVLMN